MVACQTLSRISVFQLCESLALLKNHHLLRESLSRKIVNFG